jgi:hypothetical protein
MQTQQRTIMKDTILKLIEGKPKHYVKMITKNEELLEWINTNSLSTSDHLPSRIYSAIFQVSDICKYGNTKQFDRISTGFVGCGPAKTCNCTLNKISENVSKAKQSFSTEANQQINDKRSATMLEKYGVAYNSQRTDTKHIWTAPKIPLIIHDKLTDYEWLNEEYNVKKRSLTDIADELDVYYGTVGDYCNRFGFAIRQTSQRSLEEIQICKYITDLGIIVEESNRTIVAPKELDIYIPSAKLAIEVNGLRWHSHHPSLSKPEDRKRHISKTLIAKENGVTLMHITDYEWKHKTDIIKSMIVSRLNLNKKIHARKCIIKPVAKQQEKEFLNLYHIQGFTGSSAAIGLYYHDELVMLISIGIPRYNKTYTHEIIRMCAISGITVVGGVSKLVAYLKNTYPNSNILSYCDLSKGTGIGYENAGFVLEGMTSPGYFWTNSAIMISRSKCQKANLQKWLPSYDNTLSEAVNMFNAKYRRYWDCGNAIYRLTT